MAETEDELYRHVKRPEWGVAMIAWERNGTRAYQFEDGKLRKFPEAFPYQEYQQKSLVVMVMPFSRARLVLRQKTAEM